MTQPQQPDNWRDHLEEIWENSKINVEHRYLLIGTYIDDQGAAIGFWQQTLDVWTMDMRLWFDPQERVLNSGVQCIYGLACINPSFHLPFHPSEEMTKYKWEQ